MLQLHSSCKTQISAHIRLIASELKPAAMQLTNTSVFSIKLCLFVARSKRKVLGRKEPSDSFSCRQSLMSPVKHSTSGSDLRNLTLGSSQRSSSRNENFMALLQKKGSKSSTGGTRVSAMELLKSTNPLARRVTEFSAATQSTTGEGGDTASSKPNDQWTKAKLTNLLRRTKCQLILQCVAHCREGFLTNAQPYCSNYWLAIATVQLCALDRMVLPLLKIYSSRPNQKESGIFFPSLLSKKGGRSQALLLLFGKWSVQLLDKWLE